MPYQLVPRQGQTLLDTRDQIRNNFGTIQTAFEKNHGAYDQTYQGQHTNVVFNPGNGTQLATGANEIEIYTKTAGGLPQLFMVPQNTLIGDVATASRQLTAGDITNATFGTNTAYDAVPAEFSSISGGFTFLPGNIIMQYGRIVKDGTTSLTAVDIPFVLTWAAGPQVYSVQITYRSASLSTPQVWIGTVDTTTLRVLLSAKFGANDSLYWQAVGQI